MVFIFDLYYYPKCTCICGIKNAGYQYCLNEGSLTEKYNPNRFQMGKKLFLEKKRLLELQEIYEGAKERAEESFLQYTRYSIKSEVKYVSQNGKENVIRNIEQAISDKILVTLVTERTGKHKNILDFMIDYGIKTKNAQMIYTILSLAYKMKGR